MPRLVKTSVLFFLALLIVLIIVAWWPTPLGILLCAGLLSGVVLLQVYLVLTDDSMPPRGPVHGNYEQF